MPIFARRFAIQIKNGTIMGTIASSDIIYATISKHGRIVASFSICGLTTIRDIISYIRRVSALTTGMLKLNLRNRSQGWSHTRSISIPPCSQPIQLSLF